MNKENIKGAKRQGGKEVKHIAFSLAEMMLVFIIVSIVLSMLLPIITKRRKSNAIITPPASVNTGVEQLLYLYGTHIYVACPCTDHYTTDGTNVEDGGDICQQLTNIGSSSLTRCFPDYPRTCPNGWDDGGVMNKDIETLVRSCSNPTKQCATLYLYGKNTTGACGTKLDSEGINIDIGGGICQTLVSSDSSVSLTYPAYPPTCPSGWTDAGVGIGTSGADNSMLGIGTTLIRSCYKCD